VQGGGDPKVNYWPVRTWNLNVSTSSGLHSTLFGKWWWKRVRAGDGM